MEKRARWTLWLFGWIVRGGGGQYRFERAIANLGSGVVMPDFVAAGMGYIYNELLCMVEPQD